MVRCYAVAKQREHSAALQLRRRRRRHCHSFEERWLADVRGVAPRVLLAFRHRQLLPVLITLENILIALPEHLSMHGTLHGLLNLVFGGPEVFQEHRLARWILAEWLGGQVLGNPSRERVSNDERRR